MVTGGKLSESRSNANLLSSGQPPFGFWLVFWKQDDNFLP
jgi:hypothetical protein